MANRPRAVKNPASPQSHARRGRNLTVPEFAQEFGITERAVWMKIYRQELPHFRWGRRVFIPRAQLEAFFAALPGTNAEEATERVAEASR